MRKKKATMQDVMFFGIIIFIIAIIMLVGGKLSGSLNSHYQASGATATAKDLMEDTSSRYYGIGDSIFFVVFILFALTIFGSMFLLDTHPVFFWVTIIIFAIILMVLGMVGNAYDDFSDNPDMMSEESHFTFLTAIMDNWVMLMLVVGFIATVVLFAKFKT